MCYLIFIYIKSHLICFKKKLAFFCSFRSSSIHCCLEFGGIWNVINLSFKVRKILLRHTLTGVDQEKKNPRAYCLLHILARISTKTHRGPRNCFMSFAWERSERMHTGSRNGNCWRAGKVCDQWVIKAGFCRRPSGGGSHGESFTDSHPLVCNGYFEE